MPSCFRIPFALSMLRTRHTVASGQTTSKAMPLSLSHPYIVENARQVFLAERNPSKSATSHAEAGSISLSHRYTKTKNYAPSSQGLQSGSFGTQTTFLRTLLCFWAIVGIGRTPASRFVAWPSRTCSVANSTRSKPPFCVCLLYTSPSPRD